MGHLVKGLVDTILQVFSEAVVDVYQLLNVTKHHSELLSCQQRSALHGAVKLLLDDPQVLAVARLRIQKLQDGFFALGAQLGASFTHALSSLFGGPVPQSTVWTGSLSLPGSEGGRWSLPGAGQTWANAAVHPFHLGSSVSAVTARLAVLLLPLITEAHHSTVCTQAADGAPAMLPGSSHTKTSLALLTRGLRTATNCCWSWGERVRLIYAHNVHGFSLCYLHCTEAHRI